MRDTTFISMEYSVPAASVIFASGFNRTQALSASTAAISATLLVSFRPFPNA
jgi:hypothetical protein